MEEYVYLRALGIEPPPFWERWWNLIQLPMINAAMELSRGKPARAIELLQPVAFYERRLQVPAYAWARLPRRPPRGGSGRGVPKILAVKAGNSVLVFPGLLYPLTYLGLAPAEALSGDVGKAKKAYQHLFTSGKTPIPISKSSPEPTKNSPRNGNERTAWMFDFRFLNTLGSARELWIGRSPLPARIPLTWVWNFGATILLKQTIADVLFHPVLFFVPECVSA